MTTILLIKLVTNIRIRTQHNNIITIQNKPFILKAGKNALKHRILIDVQYHSYQCIKNVSIKLNKHVIPRVTAQHIRPISISDTPSNCPQKSY